MAMQTKRRADGRILARWYSCGKERKRICRTPAEVAQFEAECRGERRPVKVKPISAADRWLLGGI